MKVLITVAVLLIMLARVNSVPLESGVLSESYLEKVQEQLEERSQESEENQHQRETRSASDNTDNSTTSKTVRHGSTVAFQQYTIYWLGCSTTTTRCAKNRCPGMYMRGNEWNSCNQNVFQIFRAKGHGDVRVGDLVGLYLTRESGKWFGCSGTLCTKNSCPGTASYEYGFNTPELWYRCYGSVFKIYAHEKQLGDIINDQDDIMLFYLRDLDWIAANDRDQHHDCPGNIRPPPHDKYDGCDEEVYRIWKK